MIRMNNYELALQLCYNKRNYKEVNNHYDDRFHAQFQWKPERDVDYCWRNYQHMAL